MEERLEIAECPVCGGKHTYRLQVERTFLLYDMTLKMAEESLKETRRPVRFTRIFVCPVKDEKFQALFQLYETQNSEIESVKVEGAI